MPDEKVKVSSTDSTEGYLNPKVSVGENISTAVVGGDSNPQTLKISGPRIVQVFRCLDLPAECYGHGKYPSTAGAEATPTISTNGRLIIPAGNTAATIDYNFLRFDWTSQQFGGQVTHGTTVAVGVPFRRQADYVFLRARIRFNDHSKFDNFHFGINDVNDQNTIVNSNVHTLAGYTAASDNKWVHPAFSSALDVSGWANEDLRATFTAVGTSNSANVGTTLFDIEFLVIEQYK